MERLEHVDLSKLIASFHTTSDSFAVSTSQGSKGFNGFGVSGQSVAMAVVCNVCAADHQLSVSPIEMGPVCMSQYTPLDNGISEDSEEDWDSFQEELLSGEEIDRINEYLKSTGQASA